RGRCFFPGLERLEDRVAPAILPPTVAAELAAGVKMQLPQLFSSSLGNASNVPMLGTALAMALAPDAQGNSVGKSFAEQIATALQAPTGQHYQADGAAPTTVRVDPVHATATEQVPFALPPLGPFLTVTSPSMVSVKVDIYYAAAFQFHIDPM